MFIYSIIYAIIFNIDSFGIGITYGLKNTKMPSNIQEALRKMGQNGAK